MKTRCSFVEQSLAQFAGEFHTERTNGIGVIGNRIKSSSQVRREGSTREFGEPNNLCGIGDRHNARKYGFVAAKRRQTFNKTQIRFSFKEELGDSEIGRV